LKAADRVRAVIDYQRVDRPAVAPELIAVTATLCGVRVIDYVRDGAIIAECQLAAAEQTGSDVLFAASDLCVEAEALGCRVHFTQDNYPHIAAPVIDSISGMAQLSIPDPASAGRMPQTLRAVELLSASAGGRLVMGNAVGPITMASRIMDIEKMLYMIVDHPDQFRQIMEFCTRVSIRFIEAIIQAGAGGILIFDPSASPSLLPARIFREFVVEPVREIMTAAKTLNPAVVTWYSVAGPVQTNPAIMTSIAADVTTVDYPVPLQTAMEYSGYTVINGNIKPSLFLEGNPDQVYSEAMLLLEETRLTERFILGSGCEIPLNSPLENIRALRHAADDMASRRTPANPTTGDGVKITFLPHNRIVHVPEGESILEAATRAGAPITTYCDLSGSCGECVVTVDKGKASSPDQIEQVQLASLAGRGQRLACLAKAMSDMEVYVPHSSRRLPGKTSAPDILIETHNGVHEGLSPIFNPATGEVEENMDPFPLAPATQESAQGPATGATAGCSVGCGRGAARQAWYGVAVDISGENAAAYVHDLLTGELVHAGSFANPATLAGAGNAMEPRHKLKLQEEITRLFNSIISWLYECNSIMPERVRGTVATSCGIADDLLRSSLDSNPRQWAQITCGQIAGTRISDYPGLRISLMPFSAAQGIHSSQIAFIIAALRHTPAGSALFVNIGAEGCVSLMSGGQFSHVPFSTSSLLERTIPRTAMRFMSALIHKAQMDETGHLDLKTIGGGAPLGMLGSALAPVAVGMLHHGIINPQGGFLPGAGARVANGRFVLAPRQKTAGYNPISVSSEDLAELFNARDACLRAITTALGSTGGGAAAPERIFVTGPLGVLLEPEDLVDLGFLPAPMRGKITFIKNGAGLGARMALLSRQARDHAEAIAQSCAPDSATTQQNLSLPHGD